METQDVDTLAKVIWNYHLLHQPLRKSDAIFLLCSNDIRVATHAAQLFLAGWAPLVIISGGISHQGDLLEDRWEIPPAEKFSEVIQEHGVPRDKILTETRSTNTGENITFTKQLLAEHGLALNTFIAVQKPYMERRAYVSLCKQWPNVTFIMSSPPISFEQYPNEEIPKDVLIHLMVGDLQRIKVYPDLGYQIPQEIPTEVWRAYEELVSRGYTKHLINS